MTEQKLIPHFVADRPMSLRILSGMDLKRHPVNVGLMVQACSSQNFRDIVSKFPCGDVNYCGVVDGPCPHGGKIKKCNKGSALRKHFTTIADSGVFTKEGSNLSYSSLFERYQEMHIKRGIILDVLGDKNRTIESAKIGWEYYDGHGYDFTLVGVAQGKDLKEYVKCYEKLLNIGYEEVAIGGLLTKHENTARYASSNRDEISRVVKKIKSEWPDKRCFTLGVYNPKRHEFLEEIGVDGADYKGWIFQYKKKYEDPLCHHIDRIYQTRNFIEQNILSRTSGRKAIKRCIHTLAQNMKNQLISQKSRVVVDNKPIKKSDDKLPNRIVIISCGKSKNNGPDCLAKEAYKGRSFLLKRKYAELSGQPWLILSAKYGLLKPDKEIDPNYNMTVSTKSDVQQLALKIAKQIPDFLEYSIADEVIFLGPGAYVQALEKAFAGNKAVRINHITKGLGQGKTQKKIRELIHLSIQKMVLITG
jgi:hypothetical protein